MNPSFRRWPQRVKPKTGHDLDRKLPYSTVCDGFYKQPLFRITSIYPEASAHPESEEQMREVTDLEAQAGFDQILEEVEKGETVRIFRDGRPIACLLPEENGPSQLLSDPVAGTPFPESTNPDSE